MHFPVGVSVENRFAGMRCHRAFSRWRFNYRRGAHLEDAFPEHRASPDAEIGIWIFTRHTDVSDAPKRAKS